ncbi:MAG: uroporphyrinogen decarboxylase family protein [Verrucomicrobiota bacterium]|jgi:MtaA/CmuA family methyltransferase
MNSRERVLNLIEGKPVDRPPAMPITMMWSADLIGVNYHDYATRAQIQAAAQCAAAGQFGFDHVSVISDPCCEAADLGADIFYPPDGPPAIIEKNALLADPSVLGTLRVPDPHRAGGRMANRVAAVRLLRHQLGGTHLIEGWVEGPCAESANLRGISTIMMDYYDDPDFAHVLAEFTVKVALKFAAAQIEAGADIIGVGDAAASLINRGLYDQFVLPHEKRLVEGIHAAGGRVRLHICGRTQHLAGSMATLGCEIVDLDSMVDLRAARADLGDRQVLLGNVHPVNVVRNGTPEEVRQALAKCHAEAGPAWIAGAGCEVPRHSPAENVRRFAQIV